MLQFLNYRIVKNTLFCTEFCFLDESEESSLLFSSDSDSYKFIITRGDYSELLKRVNQYLLKAKVGFFFIYYNLY